MSNINLIYKNIFNFLFLLLLPILIILPNTLNAHNNEISTPVDSWPPFRIINDKKYSGIDFDLLNELSKRMNLKLKIKEYPWSRSLLNMKNGKVDIMIGVAKRTERALYMQYLTMPYYTCSTVFYVKKRKCFFNKNL